MIFTNNEHSNGERIFQFQNQFNTKKQIIPLYYISIDESGKTSVH